MDLERIKQKIAEMTGGGKSTRILVAMGIIGMALILISSVFPEKADDRRVAEYTEYSTKEYTAMLEERLCDIVGQITGNEQVSVMITLESGVEKVYANQIKQSADRTEDETGEGSLKKQNDTTEESYIMVEDESGNKTALLLTSLSPTVAGVVIVCEGGEDAVLAETVRDSVKTVLNISASRVCVVGKNK